MSYLSLTKLLVNDSIGKIMCEAELLLDNESNLIGEVFNY
jgi:hypothetical protein